MDGASFESGMASVALGAALHYVIAPCWTAIFFAASQKFSGLLYGIGVFLFMN